MEFALPVETLWLVQFVRSFQNTEGSTSSPCQGAIPWLWKKALGTRLQRAVNSLSKENGCTSLYGIHVGVPVLEQVRSLCALAKVHNF